MKTVEVVAAIIIKDQKILCMQRSKDDPYLAFKWEFPGGKIEKGESHQEALKREIKEELNLEIVVKGFFLSVDHLYHKFRVVMHAYICEMLEDNFSLEEHNNFKWLDPIQLEILDWAEADIPIVEKIIEKL